MSSGITTKNNGKRKIDPSKYNYQKSALKALWYCNHYGEKGLDFDVFCKLIKEPCFYCGDIETKTFNRALRDRQKGLAVSDAAIELGEIKYNGIDKLIPSESYIEGNIVSCCAKCNFCKCSLTKEDFLNQVEKIHNHQANKPEIDKSNPIVTAWGEVIGYGRDK